MGLVRMRCWHVVIGNCNGYLEPSLGLFSPLSVRKVGSYCFEPPSFVLGPLSCKPALDEENALKIKLP